MAARKLVLHYTSTVQQLKFFPGASRDDLLAGIREVLDVAPGTPLRFRDADGDVVLLTPGMPCGTVLHVMVESGVPLPPQPQTTPGPLQNALSYPTAVGVPVFSTSIPPNSVQVPSTQRPGTQSPANSQLPFPIPVPVECNPDAPPERALWQRWEAAVGGSISDDSATFNNSSGEGWSVYSAPLPTAGQHYFTVDCDERLCCVAIGVISTTISSVPHTHLIADRKYPYLVALKGVGKGPSGAGNTYTGAEPSMPVGVFVDADRRMMVLVPHDDPQNESRAIRLDGVPLPMKLVIAAPKHSITATISPARLPAAGVYTGPAAIFSKPAPSARE